MAKLAKPVALVALVAALAAPAMAQSSGAHPSFDGVWTNASSTKLERSAAYKDLVVPKAEADAAREAEQAQRRLGDGGLITRETKLLRPHERVAHRGARRAAKRRRSAS